MKRIFSSLLAIAIGMTAAYAAETITVNSSVKANIEITAAGEYLLEGDFTQCAYPVIVAENLGNVTITSKNVKVYPSSSNHGMKIGAGTTVTLKLDGANHYQGKSQGAGIEMQGSLIIESVNNSLTDSLYTQGSYAPGIGVYTAGVTGGDLTINGGTVYARGTDKSAAIGTSCYASSSQAAKIGKITINGGNVNAVANGGGKDYYHCAGIGCGYYADDTKNKAVNVYEKITINGGKVYAQGYGDAAGIGCIKYTTGGDIEINGGTVVAVGKKYSQTYPGIGGWTSFTGKLIVTGGSVNGTIGRLAASSGDALSADYLPVNGAGTVVAQIVGNTTANALVKFGSVIGTDYNVVLGTDYNIKDTYADAEGKVYLWLPVAPADAEILINSNKIDLSKSSAITAATDYLVVGEGTTTLDVAGGLGDITLFVNGTSVNAATALNIGAGTNVIINEGSISLVGNITGAGTLTLNGGTHLFKGAQPTINVVVNGGNIQTVDASGNDLAWTGVKNGEGKDLALIVGEMKAETQVKNGFVKGTDYEFILKGNYNLTDMYSNAEGKVYLYAPATLPSDAVALFNQLEEIDLDANGSNDIIIDAEGAYQLNGTGVRTKGRVYILENVGNVTLTLNNVWIQGSGTAITNNAGNTVVLKLVGENKLYGGATYNTALVTVGDLIIEGPGSLYAEGSTGAAIGGQHSGGVCGNITINGGVIEAKGSTYGAGIGAAYVGKALSGGTTITINGGTIISRAGTGTRAIGKSDTSSGTFNVIVNGGSVKALNSSKEEMTMSSIKNTAGDDVTLFKTQLAETTEATRVYGGTIGTVTLGGEGYGMNDVYTDAEGYLWFYIPEQDSTAAVNLITTKPVVEYEVSVSAENGTVSCTGATLTDGKAMVEEGTELTFTAEAETGYVFDYWVVNGEKQTETAAELKLTVTAQTTVVAVFKKEVSTAIDNTKVAAEVRKVVENGVIYILRGGKKYTTTGVVVK